MKKVKTRKKTKTPRRSSDVFSAVKANETRLSQTAMHLEYSFERGVNFMDRSITIRGDIDDMWFDVVDAAMSEFERNSKKGVTIKIYSEGGSVYEALAIVGRLKRSKCWIITEGYGAIMSAATIILACGDNRKMSKYAHFMHHEASYGFEGKHTEAKTLVDQMEKEEKLWSKWMAEFSDKSEGFWFKWGKHTDKYLTVDKCIEYGVVDEEI